MATALRTSSVFRFFAISILSVFIISSLASNQVANGQVDVKPGFKAGVNFASYGGSDSDRIFAGSDLQFRTGFMVGGLLMIDPVGPFALQTEFLYIQKGQKAVAVDPFGDDVTVVEKLNYIEVPVLAKFQIPVAGPISPTLFAGPAVGVNVGAESETREGDSTVSRDFEDRVTSTDVVAHFGGGFDIEASVGVIMLDIRYQLGLTNVVAEGELEIENRGIGVTAGLAF